MLEENRLALIRKWSMDGARAAIVAERTSEPVPNAAVTTLAPVLVQAAGGDDWRPLFANPNHA